VKVGDRIIIQITCKQKCDHNKHIIFDCLCTNQDNLKVIAGEAEVLAPTQKVKRELEHLSDAVSGGVVLGGRVPIVLANRNDSIESGVASLVLTLLVANQQR
jgi:uncharacterized membrane protein